ncbi:MAG: malate synthase A, partial [Nannocystaceae bacterium]|nr:malate synthase A [Nannocystaceae bacterium]
MPSASHATPSNVDLLGPVDGFETILSEAALAFVAALTVQFRPKIQALLATRREVQALVDAGQSPDFLAETAAIRDGDWRVGPIPADLTDRRVEITGPIDAKMIINALNSGANVFMADCEDSCAPVWATEVAGQQHLHDAVRGTLKFRDDARNKDYALLPADQRATLMVRPRGLHLQEKHMLVQGEPVPASLFDFGLYFFHNARELVARGSGPYFYLPKLQSHHEARLWNEVFCAAQDALGIDRSTIRAT